MWIGWTYINKKDAALRALGDLETMKFILEQTDDKTKEMAVDIPDHYGQADDESAPIEYNPLVLRYQRAKEYMEWFGPAWAQMMEKEQILLYEAVIKETPYGEICNLLGIKKDAFFQRRKRAIDKLTRLLYGVEE